jgi:FMN reductase
MKAAGTLRRIAVVTAGLSQPSSTRLLADQLAAATRTALQGDGNAVEISVIELRDLAQDITNNLLTGFPAPALAAAVEQISAADALIAVTPIFSASYSGLFKSFFDVLDPDLLTGKPVLIGATGGSPRHSLALEHAVRPLFSYLHALVAPTAVYAASADWGTAGDREALSTRITQAGAQLGQLVASVAPTAAADPFANFTPFSDL